MTPVCSFYTQDWKYPQYAASMKASCERLGLRHRIEERKSQNNWLGNCCIKPFFIRDCLRDEKGPVLWLDVDGSIYQKPVWFDGLNADFAAKRKPPGSSRFWMVCTLWFNYTPAVLEFIDSWCDMTGDCSDESSLNELWAQGGGSNLRWTEVPPEYFEVTMNGWKQTPKTVIAHRWSKSDSKKQQMAELRRKRGW